MVDSKVKLSDITVNGIPEIWVTGNPTLCDTSPLAVLASPDPTPNANTSAVHHSVSFHPSVIDKSEAEYSAETRDGEDAGLVGSLTSLDPFTAELVVVLATNDHRPTSADEISLKKGDAVLVHGIFKEGWILGTNHRSKRQGLVPEGCLEEVQNPHPPVESLLKVPSPLSEGRRRSDRGERLAEVHRDTSITPSSISSVYSILEEALQTESKNSEPSWKVKVIVCVTSVALMSLILGLGLGLGETRPKYIKS